jgi:hypothetical protein
MTTRYDFRSLALAVSLAFAPHAVAQDFAPAGNLAGITNVHEKISVGLNLKGADEFRLDSQKITAILRDALSTAGIGTNGSGTGTPMVSVGISGETTGGGGARYTVELSVRATTPSPFTRNRSVEAIFWRGVAAGEEVERYDATSKGFIKPTGPINERVYTSVREVAARLAIDLKKANASR